VKELRKDWALGSSLRLVIFEFGFSLRRLIETDKVDLSHGFEIQFLECNRELNFPGYSVQPVHGAKGVFRLVKTSSSGGRIRK
jgi:hypothetical protein